MRSVGFVVSDEKDEEEGILDLTPLRAYSRHSISRRLEERTVRLKTVEDRDVDLSVNVAEMSPFLKDRLDEKADASRVLLDCRIEVIKLPFRESLLKKIVEYMEIHENSFPKEIQLARFNKMRKSGMISTRDLQWLGKIPREDQFEMCFIAEYLNIRPLVKLLCANMSLEITDPPTFQLTNPQEPGNNLGLRSTERLGHRDQNCKESLESLLLGIPLPKN